MGFCAAVAGCIALRALSFRSQLLDQPNERSLHTAPTPRLGGAAIVLAFCLALAVAVPAHRTPLGGRVTLWLAAALPIALLGLVDDLRPLKAATRLSLQLAVAAAFCLMVGLPSCVPLAATLCIPLSPAPSLVLWVLVIVGLLNIFNFMDGMDGLAGTQATCASLALGQVFVSNGAVEIGVACILLSTASLGFLVQNAPPARIFMGDAGSTFLGFSFGALALLGARNEPVVPLHVSFLALAPFLLDGGSTLVRRAIRGEAVWRAHRAHLYQRAVTAGRSHRQVLVVYAVWIVAAGTAAVLTEGSQPRVVALAGFAMVTALIAVWRWVLRLERASLGR